MSCHAAINVSSSCYMRPHTAINVSYCHICVLLLLYMCPHAAYMCPHAAYMCHHTAICVLILLYVSSYSFMCPRTPLRVRMLHICVLILLHVSSYCYICVSAAELERTLLHVRAAEAALLQVSFFLRGGGPLFVEPLL
jgi:hypothetical protein